MKADKKIGKLYLYDDIAPDSYDWWSGEKIPSETSAQTVSAKLAEMGDISELNVYICSRGGDVATGNAIYSQLQRISVPKTAYIDGLAASIATVIACGCDHVVMYKTGIFMIHNAAMGVYGNAEELRRGADVLDVYSEAARQAYVGRCKISEEEIAALMDAESYLTAAEALEYGFIDEIADKPVSEDLPEDYHNAEIRMKMECKDRENDVIMARIMSKVDERFSRIENIISEKLGDIDHEKGAEGHENGGIVPKKEEKQPENKGNVPDNDIVEKFLMAFLG